MFWDTLVHLGWRQDKKEQKLGDEVNLILQLVLECPDCSKAIRTVNTHNIGQDGATTVQSLFKAEEDLERHRDFYCESKSPTKRQG